MVKCQCITLNLKTTRIEEYKTIRGWPAQNVIDHKHFGMLKALPPQVHFHMRNLGTLNPCGQKIDGDMESSAHCLPGCARGQRETQTCLLLQFYLVRVHKWSLKKPSTQASDLFLVFPSRKCIPRGCSFIFTILQATILRYSTSQLPASLLSCSLKPSSWYILTWICWC